jgi:trimeric autotransporter adhesin
MLSFRQTLAAASALASWSCGSSTQPDATPQVAIIAVSPSTPSVAVNAQVPLQAEVRDASGALVPDAEVTWTVQDPTIVSVSAAGVVTGLKLGTSQVAANALGKSGLATVTVTTTPVASVVVQPGAVDVQVGKTYQLVASVLDAAQNPLSGRPVNWTSGTPAVATVNSNTGLVTAIAPGTTRITATAGGVSGNATVTVSPVPVATVSLSPGNSTIVQNAQVSFTATTKDASGAVLTGRPVTWTVDRQDIANLSATSGQSIVVTGGVSGTAVLKATSEASSTTVTVTVTDGTVSSVSVSAASTTIKKNTSTTASATVRDAAGKPLQGRTVAWSVPGGDPATLSPSTSATSSGGVAMTTVTAKSVLVNDTARITATVGGKSGSVTITVTP